MQLELGQREIIFSEKKFDFDEIENWLSFILKIIYFNIKNSNIYFLFKNILNFNKFYFINIQRIIYVCHLNLFLDKNYF